MNRFPTVLHKLLVCSDSNEIARRIASWSQCGQFFTIHDRNAFEKTLLPKFCKHKKYKSFVRQLHMYNFQRVPGTKSKQSYFHVDFHRDFPELCELVLRKGSTGESVVGTSKPKVSPMIASSLQTPCVSSPNPQEFSGTAPVTRCVSPLLPIACDNNNLDHFHDITRCTEDAAAIPNTSNDGYFLESYCLQPSNLLRDVEVILANSESLFQQDEREMIDIVDEIVNTFCVDGN